jgi:GTP-binding protein
MLGTVTAPGGEQQFTVADIPGLLEGAHRGVGLGDEFLAHLERTRLLIHVVDIAGYYGQQAVDNFVSLIHELAEFSPGLASRSQLVAVNKTDLASPGELSAVETEIAAKISEFSKAGDPAFAWITGEDDDEDEIDPGKAIIPISAATGDGIDMLKQRVYQLLQESWRNEPETESTETAGHTVYRPGVDERWDIKTVDDYYVVTGPGVERLVKRTDFKNDEAVAYLQEQLEQLGVSDALRATGAGPGSDVVIGEMEFEFW